MKPSFTSKLVLLAISTEQICSKYFPYLQPPVSGSDE